MNASTKANPAQSLRYACLSDLGRVRSANEDRCCADPQGRFFIVADGIGGHSAGGLAAQIVVELLPRRLNQVLSAGESPAASAVADKVAGEVARLSDRIRDETRNEPGLAGLGTTVVVAVLGEREGFLVHLGDSRAYLLRGGRLTQLTRDHTLLQLLIEEGRISPEEARVHPAQGRLTRFLGMEGAALPETTRLNIEHGDRLLLCTDGLSGMLDAPSLERILREQADPHDACRLLIEQANAAGGRDNITAIVVAV
jgi:PPM family protein phosphatase